MTEQQVEWSGPFTVVVTRKNGPGSRHKTWNSAKDCEDQDHARNYARKVVQPNWYQGRNISDVVKVTVWLDNEHCVVWTRTNGWAPVRYQERRRRR